VEPPKPERLEEMLQRVERYFDYVMVHGDERLVPFERTFPHAHRIADRLRYTGYVTGKPAPRGRPGDDGWAEVIVSAGGGAVGDRLLRTALQARPLSTLADRRWRILAGVNATADDLAALRALAPPGVIVEPARGDFTTLLANCTLSISQAGY